MLLLDRRRPQRRAAGSAEAGRRSLVRGAPARRRERVAQAAVTATWIAPSGFRASAVGWRHHSRRPRRSTTWRAVSCTRSTGEHPSEAPTSCSPAPRTAVARWRRRTRRSGRRTSRGLRLWRALTVLREHRGDGRVAALVAADLGLVESEVLTAAWAGDRVDLPMLRRTRRIDDDAWAAGSAALGRARPADRSGRAHRRRPRAPVRRGGRHRPRRG